MMHSSLLRCAVFLGIGLLCASTPAPPAAAQESVKKVVLLAGPLDAGHPRGTHEYERSAMLLKHCLDTAVNLQGIRTELHLNGWPEDPATLDDADTIVVIASGSDRNEPDHPLLVGDRLAIIEKQMARGCGLAMIHWATFFPNRHADKILDWTGGYFDYQSGPAPNGWYSAIQHWDAQARPAIDNHPILRGVEPFTTREEFYYNIRFAEDDRRTTPILLTRPPNVERDHAVAWAIDRGETRGRGFGFTGGHYYANWFVPSFRRMVLNAIIWSAGAEVPQGGVADKLEAPIKALIVTGDNHPAHDWKSVTAALRAALEGDPRLLVEVTENPDELATRPLGEYGLLVLNYCNWNRPGLHDAAKQKFVEYLRGGGGLAVVHFANGAFHSSLPQTGGSDWPEYRKIVRRVWDHKGGSGHDAHGPFRVEITSVDHPITRGLEAFDTVDELYFNQRGEEPIEPLAMARSKISGRDEPMAWAYRYGEGRVFQTVLGHDAAAVGYAAELIRRGCIWVAGRERLEAAR